VKNDNKKYWGAFKNFDSPMRGRAQLENLKKK
jgi:hypothetical protein